MYYMTDPILFPIQEISKENSKISHDYEDITDDMKRSHDHAMTKALLQRGFRRINTMAKLKSPKGNKTQTKKNGNVSRSPNFRHYPHWNIVRFGLFGNPNRCVRDEPSHIVSKTSNFQIQKHYTVEPLEFKSKHSNVSNTPKHLLKLVAKSQLDAHKIPSQVEPHRTFALSFSYFLKSRRVTDIHKNSPNKSVSTSNGKNFVGRIFGWKRTSKIKPEGEWT